MGGKQVGWLVTVLLLVLGFDYGYCNTQDIVRVKSIQSRLEDYESVLRRDSRSVHRSRRVVLNPIEQQETIEIHNNLRRLAGASNLEILTWADDLASEADSWAQRCIYAHDGTLQAKDMGQNIYVTERGPPINVTEAIQKWYDEKNDYNYDTQACSAEHCAHYTQVVSARSREVGCAVWKCAEMTNAAYKNVLNFICNYRPPGNLEVNSVTQRPFMKGPGCSQCANRSWWCNNGLCDQSCKASGPTCGCAPVCLNFATVNGEDCLCSCSRGWFGSNCGRECKNYDPLCDPPPNQQGYTLGSCGRTDITGSIARENCPLLCVQCQGANGGNYSTSTKPSLLNLLLIWLSWLLINSFRSI